MPSTPPSAEGALGLRSALGDAAIGVAVAALMLIGGSTGVTPSGPGGQLGEGAVVIAVAVAAALAVRRRAPFTVLASLNALTAAWYALNYPGRIITAAALIGCYTLAAQRGWRWGAAGWLLTAATSVVVIHLTLDASWLGDPTINALALELAATALGAAVCYHRAFAAGAAEHADQVARARVEQTRLRDAEERLEIARDLHDAIGHSLVAISVHAGAAAHVADRDPGQAGAALATIKSISDEGLAEVQIPLGSLREPRPDDAHRGLGRLDSLLDVTRATGVTVTLSVRGEARPLPGRVDLTAFRIVQESLTNARRHATPTTIDVGLTYREQVLEILVRNDGVHALPSDDSPSHIDSTSGPAGGHGLKNTAPIQLLQGIRVVAGGEELLSPGLTRRLIAKLAAPPPLAVDRSVFDELTAREREVVALVAEGLTNTDISRRLFISPATTKTHVSRAMIKLGAPRPGSARRAVLPPRPRPPRRLITVLGATVRSATRCPSMHAVGTAKTNPVGCPARSPRNR